MKKAIIAVLAVALLISCATLFHLSAQAADLPFINLYKEGFAGYTSDELEVLTPDFVSSQKIAVKEGETLWFGPCRPSQYYHLVGLNADGAAATDKIRGKELTVADEFGNKSVIYQYTVPANVTDLVFAVPANLKNVYSVSKTEITALTFNAYWTQQGVDTDEYVGVSSYYDLKLGDKLYFGVITEADALSSVVYNKNGEAYGTMAKEDLRLVENFGGELSIYCYTVTDENVAYTKVNYNTAYEQYYYSMIVPAGSEQTDEEITSLFISEYGVPLPLNSTVNKLSGKSALFLGDSITYGARDRAKIYEWGGWAGRIDYYVGMDVTNNGVSGACISTARRESSSEAHYIYNNLIRAKDQTFDYVIMHGLFNDASEKVAVGTMQGKANFDPAKADVTTYAGGLELLFYQARVQNPNAILGFIVNFKTDRAVDQLPYVNMAIDICENWGIEYLDLYNMEGFKVEFDDGLHPSSAGYDSMYNIVADWMATLDGKIDTPAKEPAKVVSYNVFWGQQTPDGVADIENRYAKVLDMIASMSPDILLMQEFTNSSFGPMFDQKFAGVYERSGQTHWTTGDEMAPVAWKTSKFTAVEQGTFRVEDPDYPRAINYVVLQDNAGDKILAMSVHGQPDKDGGDKTAVRTETMKLVAQKVAELTAKHGDIPAIVGGDFNISTTSDAYAELVNGGLTDIRALVNNTAGGSYNAWTREQAKFAMGDYLFMNKNVTARSFQVIVDEHLDTGRTDGVKIHISDHCPIVTFINY